LIRESTPVRGLQQLCPVRRALRFRAVLHTFFHFGKFDCPKR
jgi:hypothetical protein